MQFKNRDYFYVAFLIVCLAIGLRSIGLEKSIWLDEYSSLSVSTLSSDYIESLRNYDHPPTYFLLLKLWSNLSDSVEFQRMLSVIFGILTLVVMMAWLKPVSSFSSLLVGLICATMPIFLRYSQEIRNYSLLLFAIAFSFYSASRTIAKPSWPWQLALAFGLSLTVTTHLIGAMVLPIVFIYLFPELLRQKNGIRWRRFLLVVSIPVLIFCAIYFSFLKKTTKKSWWMPALSLDLILSQFNYVFGMPMLLAYEGDLAGYHWTISFVYRHALLLILIFCGFSLVFLGNWRKNWVLLGAAIVYWLEIILYSVLFLPIFWYRTLLPGMVPFIGFIGLQIHSIKFPKIRFAIAMSMCILCAFLATGWYSIEACVSLEPWKAAGEFLESNQRSGDFIVFYPSYLEGPTKYYFTALQPENTILVKLGMNIKKIDLELKNRLELSKKSVSPRNLFLIVRPDRSTDRMTFDHLTAHLSSLAVHVHPPRKLNKLFLFQYELSK